MGDDDGKLKIRMITVVSPMKRGVFAMLRGLLLACVVLRASPFILPLPARDVKCLARNAGLRVARGGGGIVSQRRRFVLLSSNGRDDGDGVISPRGSRKSVSGPHHVISTFPSHSLSCLSNNLLTPGLAFINH